VHRADNTPRIEGWAEELVLMLVLRLVGLGLALAVLGLLLSPAHVFSNFATHAEG
jgi:hypothetical protein